MSIGIDDDGADDGGGGRFGPEFSIEPSSGQVAAHESVFANVTFRPLQLNADVRRDRIRCSVDGAEPLYLSLTGSCVNADGMKPLNSSVNNVNDDDVLLQRAKPRFSSSRRRFDRCVVFVIVVVVVILSNVVVVACRRPFAK